MVARGSRGEDRWIDRWNTGACIRAVKLFILYDTVMVDIYYYMFLKKHNIFTMKSKPQCKLCTYLIILIQYWFINCKKCTTQHRMLIGETEKGGEELVGIFCTFNFPLNLNLHWLIHLVVWQKPAQYCKGIILQLKKKEKNAKNKKLH